MLSPVLFLVLSTRATTKCDGCPVMTGRAAPYCDIVQLGTRWSAPDAIGSVDQLADYSPAPCHRLVTQIILLLVMLPCCYSRIQRPAPCQSHHVMWCCLKLTSSQPSFNCNVNSLTIVGRDGIIFSRQSFDYFSVLICNFQLLLYIYIYIPITKASKVST